MPVYVYHCDKCDKEFEVSQRMSDAALTDCDACGAKGSAHRVISAGAGVIFKGSGFYQTDYKNKSNGATSSSKSDSGDSSSASSGHSCGSACGCGSK